jgi:aminobenzoyl-glutamate utilization protein B
MSGCRWERHWVAKSRPGLPNIALAQTVWTSLQAVGAPEWNEEARVIARTVQKSCGIDPTDNPFIDECERLMDPVEAEAILRRDLPPSQKNSTSDDYTDMSWHAPLARFYIARPTLRGPDEFRFPAWAMNALGGIPQTIDPMIRTAAKVMAHAGIRILEDEAVRAEARREFNERTGGGINGSQWLEPLCDYPPPIAFRWPEYIETRRGHEWWIPS